MTNRVVEYLVGATDGHVLFGTDTPMRTRDRLGGWCGRTS